VPNCRRTRRRRYERGKHRCRCSRRRRRMIGRYLLLVLLTLSFLYRLYVYSWWIMFATGERKKERRTGDLRTVITRGEQSEPHLMLLTRRRSASQRATQSITRYAHGPADDCPREVKRRGSSVRERSGVKAINQTTY